MTITNDTQLLFLLPRRLRKRLRELAKAEGVSDGEYLRRLIRLADMLQFMKEGGKP